MIVVVTGMVGVDKKSYLENVCQLAAEGGNDVLLCNVGDQMYAEAPDIPPGKILDIPMKRLSSLRRSVFKDIIAKAQKRPNMIVNTHATFRWRHGLFPAVDFDQMRQLKADMYLCIIDGIVPLHLRLVDEHGIEHSLKDLIVWREEEIIGTEMLCKGVDEAIPFYCLARGAKVQTTETFYGLLFEKHVKKAYLSFPMTAVGDMKDVQRDILEFRQLMKQSFICFDPGDLEEAYLPEKARRAAEKGLDYVEAAALGRRIRLDLNEVKQVERDNQLHSDVGQRPSGNIQRRRERTPARPRGGKRSLRHLDGQSEPFGFYHPDGDKGIRQQLRRDGILHQERVHQRNQVLIDEHQISNEELAGCIDHTLLDATATREQIEQACRQAKDYAFHTVCVNGRWLTLAAELLAGSKVAVGGVVSLPLGANSTKSKVAQTTDAIFAGADEIDMVADLAAIIEGDSRYLLSQLQAVLKVCQSMRPAVVLKVIIESAALSDNQKVFACRIAQQAGADFVKTSTGLNPAGGASLEDIKLMKETAPRCRVKAAGGIRTAKQVIEMLAAGAQRIGTSSGVQIMEEFKAQQ